eukprot:TRINITY_DN31344_c0_g1_i1.p1 TRINITY_DN31344_c0_g1~~TRINITY_DN31344_c0_g1_i1.p1  ORF type:complete len:116 (+),score=52.73 TRINITY_DN31344_c0_g1_i1:41-349(+)
MLRIGATKAVARQQQRRASSLAAYVAGFGGVSATSLLASPVGSVFGTVLAYNMCVVGNNHIQYTMDLFYKDYVQDYMVYTALKYLTSLTLVLLFGQVFVEVQ